MNQNSRLTDHPDSGLASSYDYLADQSQIAGATVGEHARAPLKSHRFPVQFHGTGGEYFRIWIVNLLLMILTLGLYYPWAKVRKLRYFYSHTEVAGHPLDFHGNPRQMLRGFLLMTALLFVYGVAGNVSELAGAIAGVILALVWPALLRASLQFRLAQTSWRGLRFSFRGSLKDAYLVFIVPILMLLVLGAISAVALGALPKATEGRPLRGGEMALIGAVITLLVVAMTATAPYLVWRLKSYQHSNYALGPWQTTFKASFGEVWRVFVKSSLVAGLGLLFVLALAGLMAWGASSGASQGSSLAGLIKGLMTAGLPVLILGIVLLQTLYNAHLTASLQNLVWTRTGNRQIRFKSELSHWRLAGVMFKNLVLTGLTLGLYWPFAAVALARTKLEAMSVHTRQHPDDLVVRVQKTYKDAAGDMAADLMGLDIGL